MEYTNIFIDEVIIRDSSVHGAFINGENIEINKIIIESFGNLKKSKFSKEIKKNLNFTSKFKYLDLFEVTPKGLIIGEGLFPLIVKSIAPLAIPEQLWSVII